MKMRAWRRRKEAEGGGNTDRWLHSPCANLNLWIFKHLNRPEKCVYGVGGCLKYQIDICIYLLYIYMCVWGTFVAAAALASTHFHFSWVFNQVWIIASFCLKGSRFPFVCVCVCVPNGDTVCVNLRELPLPSLPHSASLSACTSLSPSLYVCLLSIWGKTTRSLYKLLPFLLLLPSASHSATPPYLPKIATFVMGVVPFQFYLSIKIEIIATWMNFKMLFMYSSM